MAAKRKYSAEDLQRAIAECRSKSEPNVHGVALKYGIPPTCSTLDDHVKGKVKKVGAGGSTVLSRQVEQEIVLSCIALADIGFGITKEIVDIVVHDYLEEKQISNPFTNGIPGRDWWNRFKKRWPILSERKPQHLSKARARAGCREVIDAWFDQVQKTFLEAGLNVADPGIACRLWNCDETGFCTSSSSTKLIVRRGAKAVHEVGGGSGHEFITVHCAASGSGERLPPFILYKGKNLYRRWMEGGPAGALYGVNDSGWMDASNFLSWFNKLFIPAVTHLTETAPVVLFFDGHHSHISLELINTAREKNLLLLCLPPNTTHLLQPMDVGVFAPLKSAWRQILKKFKLKTRGERVSKEVFPSLIAELWEASFTTAHSKGGFKSAGLVPFSRQHVLDKLPPTAQDTNDHQDHQTTASPRRHQRITCTSCGEQIPTTPILKTQIVSYFAGILEIQTSKPTLGQRNNLRIRVEGDAITSDEFVELLEAQKAAKEKEKEETEEKGEKQTTTTKRRKRG